MSDYVDRLITQARKLAGEVEAHRAAYAGCSKGLDKRAVFDEEGHTIMTIPIYTAESDECFDCEARAYAEARRKLDSVNEQLDHLAHQNPPAVKYVSQGNKRERGWKKL